MTFVHLSKYHISEQSWKYDTSNMMLINKNPKLQNNDSTWSLPNEEGNGNIESSGKVLALKQKKDCTYGDVVTLLTRGKNRKGCDYSSDSEMWLRSKPDNLGFFTLQNLATGKYLTANAQKRKKLILTGIPRMFV